MDCVSEPFVEDERPSTESCKSASALDSAGEDMSSVPATTHVPVCDTGASSAAGSSDRLDASCVDEPVPVNGSSEDALVGRPASKKGKAKKGKADSSKCGGVGILATVWS